MSQFVVKYRPKPLSLGDWSGVVGDPIPAEVIDALPQGRLASLERIGWIGRADDRVL